jgi:uncharacterized RDD family membrane protein YckC
MSTVETTAPAAQLLRRDWRKRREIITPEGVPLTVELAEFSERTIALIVDLLICFAAAVVLLLAFAFVAFTGKLGAIAFFAVLNMVLFFLRVLYFIHFELSGRGATPGKRVAGIRVIDRRGGPLRASAVIARNLTRELEIFIPIGLIFSAGASTGVPWGKLLSIGWLICFLALLFFNRDRMRAGDLIAGTLVVVLPRQRLLGDLVETRAHFAFADDQLAAYGKRELQVLEDLLRRRDDAETRALLRDVCDRICRKIGWTEPPAPADTARFLRDFYTAQRAFLEREQLFGRPRADKFEAAAKRE